MCKPERLHSMFDVPRSSGTISPSAPCELSRSRCPLSPRLSCPPPRSGTLDSAVRCRMRPWRTTRVVDYSLLIRPLLSMPHAPCSIAFCALRAPPRLILRTHNRRGNSCTTIFFLGSARHNRPRDVMLHGEAMYLEYACGSACSETSGGLLRLSGVSSDRACGC